MEGLSCISKLIRHNIEARPDREKSLAAELLAMGLGRLVCSCVLTCVLHTLLRPAFSLRDPEVFKDFQAQGPRSLLRCFTDQCCLVKAFEKIKIYYHHCLFGLVPFMQMQADARRFFINPPLCSSL